MIRPDLKNLREFYACTLGIVVARALRREMRHIDPEYVKNGNGLVLGIGYTLPYLRSFAGKRRFISLMPQAQGATFWPKQQNRCFISEERKIPLPDCSVESVLIAHEVEFSENLANIMREVWRVLTPEGRVTVIAPNRRGLWAMADNTPFGFGRPFSKTQVQGILQNSMFDVAELKSLILTPPLNFRVSARLFRWLDRVAHHISLNFGGIIMATGKKRIYAEGTEKAQPVKTFAAQPADN